MRGGTPAQQQEPVANEGLSPHARGNLGLAHLQRRPSGPIPACAGEPVRVMDISVSFGAYPRMRGGTIIEGTGMLYGLGLSPHARGNRPR